MATEKFANNGQSTLSAAITSTGATTLTVTSAVFFPTSPQFRIIIDSEIMIVTGVSGSTFTVTRGQEGTSAATHLNLAPVNQVMTAGALNQMFADNFQVGVFASLPASEKAGRFYYATDTNQICHDNGSSWDEYSLIPNTAVTAGTYGSSSLIPSITVGADGRVTAATTNAIGGAGTIPTSGWTAHNGILWNDYLTPKLLGVQIPDNASTNWRILTQSLGGNSTYTLIATVRGLPISTVDSQLFGVYITDGTKLSGLESLWQAAGASGGNRIRVEEMTNFTTDSSTVQAAAQNDCPQMMTIKIVKDGTHRTWYYWEAGSFTQFYQETHNNFLTETDVGFGGISATNNSGIQLYVELVDWSLVAP